MKGEPVKTPILLSLLTALAMPVLAAPLAYVPNERSGNVSVIDTSTDTVLRQIAAGKRPRGIAIDPAGARLYVTDAVANELLVLDTATGATLRRIALGKSPEGVNVSHDGRLVAVAVEESNSVALIDTEQLRVVADIPVRGKNPEHAVFSPDGHWLLVSAEEAEQVDVIDVAARRQTGTVVVGLRPRGMGFTPDGSRAYIAC